MGATLILLIGILAYHNSLWGEFLYDDNHILTNPNIRQLWPLLDTCKGTTRPLIYISFALNYAFGKFNVLGYHLANMFIHILAALTLFGILQRTLKTEKLNSFFGKKSEYLAIIISLLWLVHPLQTESVSYIYQRSESLMGLFYLLTLYCSIRLFEKESMKWFFLAVLSCSLGMASKPIMVTAPIMIIIYETIFYDNKIFTAFKKRKLFYLSLSSTWIILFLILNAPNESQDSVGTILKGITPFTYALSQPQVILHYIKLSFFPVHLVLDYKWPVSTNLLQIASSTTIVLTTLSFTFYLLKKKSPLGFPGIWFFLILFPTSSFLPIKDLAFEHRMYLPSIALMGLFVVCLNYIFNKFAKVNPKNIPLNIIFSIIIVTLLTLTINRNNAYKTKISIWSDVIRKAPANDRAYNNLGLAYSQQGQYDLAIKNFNQAIKTNNKNYNAYLNRGVVYENFKRFDLAIKDYTRALNISSNFYEAYGNRANAYTEIHQPDLAIEDCNKAIEINPYSEKIFNNRGKAYADNITPNRYFGFVGIVAVYC